jgi:hypothetical protein
MILTLPYDTPEDMVVHLKVSLCTRSADRDVRPGILPSVHGSLARIFYGKQVCNLSLQFLFYLHTNYIKHCSSCNVYFNFPSFIYLSMYPECLVK